MKQNFCDANLIGKSFKNQNLSGVDFSGADIRGATFVNATLTGTNFSNTCAGLAPSRSVQLVVGSLILVTIAGLVIGYSSATAAFIANRLTEWSVVGKELLIILDLVILASFIFVILRQGLGSSLGILAILTAIVTAIVAFAGAGDSDVIGAAVIQAVMIATIVAGILIESLALSIFLAIADSKALVLPVIVALVIAPLGVREGVKGIPSAKLLVFIGIMGVISIALIALSIYISIQAMHGDRRYSLIRAISISLCASQGTSFRGATLTNADFTQATLPYTDFRQATLKRTFWFKSSKLELSRIEGTYLDFLDIRQLVISNDGQGNHYSDLDLGQLNLKGAKLEGVMFDRANLSEAILEGAELKGASFNGANLREANLQGAELEGASFNGANLSEANLEGANLAHAKLVDTQLYRAKLANTFLTGACIQNWGISTETQLKNIKCDYVYMRLLPEGRGVDRRKPDNDLKFFENDEFSAFIAPFIKTLSLYQKQYTDPSKIGKIETLDFRHNQDDNPKAIVFALEKLAEEHPDVVFEVVSVYSIGQNNINVGVAVTSGIPANMLSSQYQEHFKQYSLKFKQEQQKSFTTENAERVEKLQRLLYTVRESQGSYIGTSIVIKVEKVVMGDDKSQNIDFKGAQNVSVGNINQVAANTISNAFNTVVQSSAPQELKVELEKLNQAVAEMVKRLPEEKQREVAQDLKTLTDEATSGSPRQKWYELSAQGLMEAAEALGEVAKPVITITKSILALLVI
jgi:uncharacterized protein YjbI with pentapeptide repeats